ncbi:hypothetical protein HMI55_003057 [Coelomomyces lativittatus]|nr:hypothetical protein HMI56_006356 [Coelomomyces lativittatus]KAJ1516066.1 hypothetical protein HMI55_003057 [Coelomomyces lativittatus]
MTFSFLEIVQHGHCIAFHSSLDVWLRQHWPQAVYLCIQDQKVGLICSTTVLKACLKAGFIQTSLGLTFPSQVTSTVASRTQFLLQLCQQWKQEALFPCLQGWRNEMYSVFGAQGEIEFLIERAAAGLFGVRTYGCHMTAFVADPTTHRPTHVWIAQRSATKATFPLMLDNSVAGGLTSYCTPSQVMKRECEEEAGTIPSQVYPTSEISYLTSPNLQAQLEFNPETQFVFDAPINSTWSPRPVDGEVDHFQLLSIEDCISALLQKQFKPNCALVLIDFLLRHSILTPENTDDYLTIVHGLHRPLEWDFPGPKKFPTTHTHA